MQFSISNIWISYRGKICFSRMLKNSSRTQNVRHAASTNGKWKNFWKSVSFSPCVWFHLCLAFRQRLFLKLIWKYWWVVLTCFQHWHRHGRPFLTPRKNCIVIQFILAATVTRLIRRLFESLKWQLPSLIYDNVYLFQNFILLVDSFFFQDTLL